VRWFEVYFDILNHFSVN